MKVMMRPQVQPQPQIRITVHENTILERLACSSIVAHRVHSILVFNAPILATMTYDTAMLIIHAIMIIALITLAFIVINTRSKL